MELACNANLYNSIRIDLWDLYLRKKKVVGIQTSEMVQRIVSAWNINRTGRSSKEIVKAALLSDTSFQTKANCMIQLR